MNFVFWSILSIDFLILLLHYMRSIEIVIKDKPFSKIMKRNDPNRKEMEQKIPESILGQIIYAISSLIVGILLVAVSTSFVWLPITMWIMLGWQSALISFLLILALFSLLWILIYVKIIPGYVIKEGVIVKEAISVTFFVLISIFIKFGLPFPLHNLVEKVYQNLSNYNVTISIAISILTIGLVVTNIYLFINGLVYIVDKSKKQVKARTKIVDILTIFTFSSFISLFYIVDREWSFLDISNLTRYYETIDLFKNVLFAVLVPLVLSRFINHSDKTVINRPIVNNSQTPHLTTKNNDVEDSTKGESN